MASDRPRGRRPGDAGRRLWILLRHPDGARPVAALFVHLQTPIDARQGGGGLVAEVVALGVGEPRALDLVLRQRERLPDGDEVDIYGSDPLNPDTDGGGVSDGDEVLLGTDPTKLGDDPEGRYLGGCMCGTTSGIWTGQSALFLALLAVFRRRRWS